MSLDEKCSIRGCEKLIYGESFCSYHYTPSVSLKSSRLESTARPIPRVKTTRRLSVGGQTAAGPPPSNPQRPTYPTRQGDSTFTYSDKAMPTAFTHQSSAHGEPSYKMQYQPFSVSENPSILRPKRAIAEIREADGSTIRVEMPPMPPMPQEPHFVLNPDFPSIDKRPPTYSSQTHNQVHSQMYNQMHNQDFSRLRPVPSTTIPRRSYDLAGELANAGLAYASSLNISHAQPSPLPFNAPNATHNNPPAAMPSARAEDANRQDPSSTTVADMPPSQRRPESGNTQRREGATIHVYQKPAPIFKENLPLHPSPRKRKADATDTQPRGKEPFTKQRQEKSSTPSAPERNYGSQQSSQPRNGHQSAPLNNPRSQSHRSSLDQRANHLRGSRNAHAASVTGVVTKTNGHSERDVIVIPDDDEEQIPITASQPSKPPQNTIGPDTRSESTNVTPPSAFEINVPVENDTITVATQDVPGPRAPQQPRTEEDRTVKETRMPEEPTLAEESREAEESRMQEEAQTLEETRVPDEPNLAQEPTVAEETPMAQEPSLAQETRITEEPGMVENSEMAEEPEMMEEQTMMEEPTMAEEPTMTEGSRMVEDPTVMEESRTMEESTMMEEPMPATVPYFDSEAFDSMIYRQSSLEPPPGVFIQAIARPKTHVQKHSMENPSQYLAINPAIHYPYNRSEKWYKGKALEIQKRGGRKAWFGKVIERRRWLRAKEMAEEEHSIRTDPKPWSYDRIIDFGDVPEEKLPFEVLQNPAWVKACEWHRENETKRILRERATRDANREAWSLAERIMEDAKLASQRSRGQQ